MQPVVAVMLTVSIARLHHAIARPGEILIHEILFRITALIGVIIFHIDKQ